jgi:tetratricopeptide (TPR) repeat protein
MRLRFEAVLAVAAMVLAVSSGACDRIAGIQGRRAFKEANALYQAQDYKGAAARYEETLKLDPNQTTAYFFLGNSYDNLYKAIRKGEAENDAYLTKAIDNYKLAADKEQQPAIRKLALQYLVAAYGPDKMNDPTQARPVLERMIQMDPSEVASYFAISKIDEDAGDYDKAEATLLKAKELRPNDANVYMQLAGYYNRLGEFDKTIDALQQRAVKEPNNPEVYYTIASYYWDKAFRDFRLSDTEKRDYITKGLEADEQALKIKSDYVEAIVYKGLLLRLQANVEKDAAKQQALLKQAEALQEQAKQLQKKQGGGPGA